MMAMMMIAKERKDRKAHLLDDTMDDWTSKVRSGNQSDDTGSRG